MTTFIADLDTPEHTLDIDASRGGPPPELLAQMAAAGRTESRLRARGRHLRFVGDGLGARTTIELHDLDAGTVRVITTAEAFELAAGRQLG